MDDFGQDRCREAESGKVGRYRVSEPKRFTGLQCSFGCL